MKQISRKYIIVFILFFISMFYNILFISNLNDLSKNIYLIYYEYIYLFITTPILYLSFAIIFRVIVKELPHLISLLKNMMKTIKLNLIFSMTLNFIAIGLTITDILNPVIGALVYNVGSLIVIINLAFLMKWK